MDNFPLPLNKQFNQGFRAFTQGVLDNPYPVDSLRAKEWQRGWNAAYFRNKRIIWKANRFRRFR